MYLRDIWPSPSEVRETVASSLKAEMFTRRYSVVTTGDAVEVGDADGTTVEFPPVLLFVTTGLRKASSSSSREMGLEPCI